MLLSPLLYTLTLITMPFRGQGTRRVNRIFTRGTATRWSPPPRHLGVLVLSGVGTTRCDIPSVWHDIVMSYFDLSNLPFLFRNFLVEPTNSAQARCNLALKSECSEQLMRMSGDVLDIGFYRALPFSVYSVLSKLPAQLWGFTFRTFRFFQQDCFLI